LFQLTPASREDLDAFCERMSDSQARAFREVIRRVCADPSGRREPRHRYVRGPFRNAERYLGRRMPSEAKVWELKTNHARGLFVTDPPFLAFLPVRGKRFMTADECPWH
jgi:hypothetical protein